MKTIGGITQRLVIPVVFITACATALASAAVTEVPAFIPRPVKVQIASGAEGFPLGDSLPVCAKGDAKKAVLTALTVAGVKSSSSFFTKHALAAVIDATKKDTLGAEGYTLVVSPGTITLTAAAPAGLFYGAQTLVQAITKDTAGKPAIPSLSITDTPRFSWRGLMFDPSRRFITAAGTKRLIDLMAMHKLNIMHLHLTDDQGWRLEIKKYPRLTEVGSKRAESPVLGNRNAGDGKPCGGFYTQAEIKDIVAYAKARFVTIIPEIEMPGHSSAAIAAYPWLGNQDVPGFAPGVKTRGGVHSYTLTPSEKTFQYLDDVMTEVAALFPDAPYIHIGGDECPKDQWKQSAFAQKVMADNKLRNEHELQSYFVGRVEKIVNAKGKRLIGWDEIQEGGLSKTATMMVWRDWQWAIMAVNHGNDIVMAPTSHTYFDYGQGDTPNDPSFEVIGGNIPLEKVYEFEPIPSELTTPEQIKHVLGCQAQIWGEYAQNLAKIEYLAFPRACALAEVAWTPKELKNTADFLKRLAGHMPKLDALKVNYRKSDGTAAQTGGTMTTPAR